MRRQQRGVVLVVVSWLVVLGAVMAMSVSDTSRTDSRLVAANVGGAKARAAAESGLWLAVDGMLQGDNDQWPADGTLLTTVVNDATVSVSIQAQAGLVDLNVAPQPMLQTVIGYLLDDDKRGAELSDEILDWRDVDAEQSLFGAEVETYAALEIAAAPRNGPFNSIDTLQRLATITPAEYGLLAPVFTVHSQRPAVAAEFAPDVLLSALPNLRTKVQRTAADEGEDEPSRHRHAGAYEIFVEGQAGIARRQLSVVVMLSARRQPPFKILSWRENWGVRQPARSSVAEATAL